MARSPKSTPRQDDTEALSRRGVMPLGAIIRVVSGENAPMAHTLSIGSCVIGAGSDADMIVVDGAVSRRHVELALAPEGVTLRDLDSRNGTFYLGQRIGNMVLGLGSSFRIGSTEIELVADPKSLTPVPSERVGYRELIGRSAAMMQLFGLLTRLEGTLVNVLVEGASGVGKELVAKALHRGSSIAQGPFVVVNCGAIGRELVLSELFGHRKGAFTGANENRIGAFEAADGGTLFLDEIGELPLDMQPALLRALESGEIKPLGETATRHVKVRVIAATNRHLKERVQRGEFRDDLYYRLAIVTLAVPALQDRLDDIPALAQRFASDAGGGQLPAGVLDELQQHDWPGNVRELKNAVLAYLAIGSLPTTPVPSAGLLELALKQAIDPSLPYQQLKDDFLAVFSKAYFGKLMDSTDGNQTEAARVSGIDRSYLGKLLTKYSVSKKR